jgi:hypothetical protein
MTAMNLAQFHNGLRILNSIDAHELGDPAWWPQFRDGPPRFLLSADDPTTEIIWGAMVKRGAVASAAMTRHSLPVRIFGRVVLVVGFPFALTWAVVARFCSEQLSTISMIRWDVLGEIDAFKRAWRHFA